MEHLKTSLTSLKKEKKRIYIWNVNWLLNYRKLLTCPGRWRWCRWVWCLNKHPPNAKSRIKRDHFLAQQPRLFQPKTWKKSRITFLWTFLNLFFELFKLKRMRVCSIFVKQSHQFLWINQCFKTFICEMEMFLLWNCLQSRKKAAKICAT